MPKKKPANKRARGAARADRRAERTDAEKAYHEREIARLYLLGYTQAAIGDELGIDQSTVSRDLRRLKNNWRMQAEIDTQTAMAEILAELNAIKEAAWKKFHASSEDKGGGFLDIILRAVQQRSKVLGLEDRGLKLSPEAMMLVQSMGIDMREVSHALDAIIQQMASEQGGSPPAQVH